MRACSFLLLAVATVACASRPDAALDAPSDTTAARVGDWTANGGDVFGARYSPLSEVTRANVATLEVAWTHHTGETSPEHAARRRTSFEATPLVVGGTMYLSTPTGRVLALEPETGRERWTFDPKVDRSLGFGDFTSRGVSYWAGGARGSRCGARIFIATIDARLIALDAADGTPCADFGDAGVVDLRRGLRNAPFEIAEYEVTSPPTIVGDLVVTGSGVADNNRIDAASGEVRAFDARTGALRWTWDPVPQDSTDAAWATWIGPRAHHTGAANAWTVLAADPARDLVFVPTGSASPDYFGGERLGDNRYANSLTALRASTGKVVWSFQAVHHDLWDYDVASPPALVTLQMNGREVPAVVQATKTAQLFVLDRETGAPLFPVEERPVPASDIPGERPSRTQPFTTITPPLSPHRMSADDAWGPTPADREVCRARIASLRNEGIYTPPSERGTLVFPSNIGGAHWGGVAIDVRRRIAVIPVNRVAAVVQLIPRAQHARESSVRSRTRAEYTDMRGTPYVMRREILLGPSGLPCTPPPFGELVAISLDTGKRLWAVPLGDASSLGPAGADTASAHLALGSPNLGGPIATAGGVVFIGATLDHAIRAFDVETGRELWQAPLPAGGKATPMTFRGRDGRQYVVIAAGGDGEVFGTGDALVAFRLPR